MDISLEVLRVKGEKLAESTKKTYKKLFSKLYSRLGDTDQITTEAVKDYVDEQYGPPKCPNTKRLVTIVFNAYVLKPRNLRQLRVPRPDHSVNTKKNHYDSEELEMLLEASANDPQLYHCLRVAAATGMRINEILALTCKDVVDGCIKNPIQITVRCGKGGKSRVVMVANSERDYFTRELMVLTRDLAADDKIFTTKYDNMLRKLKVAMVRCGIYDSRHRGFHGMRSYYCTKTLSQYMERNFPYAEEVLRQTMGHSSAKTTRGYVRPGRDERQSYALRT